MTTTDPKATLKISGPVDLISGIPYLLGFNPRTASYSWAWPTGRSS